ncbi:MAG: Uma2 family endonuclease [Saprospiraceae bacterium]|nr:Uma2 family endonuclease [Saprospiraceae bacterium]
MKFQDLDLSKKYTYADYVTWTFDEMVELIRGKVFKMSPAPNLYHQKISSNLHGLIFHYLYGKPCQVFHAPFDVILPLPPKRKKDNEIDTVVQPDICVVCDSSKLEMRGCLGAPDWIIEILSPGTSRKDLKEKFEIYEHAGVQEYWVVHPHEQTLLIYRLNNKGYYIGDPRPYVAGDTAKIGIFDDFDLPMEDVFRDVLLQ